MLIKESSIWNDNPLIKDPDLKFIKAEEDEL